MKFGQEQTPMKKTKSQSCNKCASLMLQNLSLIQENSRLRRLVDDADALENTRKANRIIIDCMKNV
jgi:hypothetical protein